LKVKLVHKLFVAFLLCALMIVALMIGIVQLSTQKNLSDYANQAMLSQIDNLVSDLQAVYRRQKSWDHRIFRPMLDRNFPELADSPETSRQVPPPPRETEERPDQKPGNTFRPPPAPPPQSRLNDRLSLFDAEKRPVAGPAQSAEGHAFREIIVDGRIVGWLGLRTGDEFLSPLDRTFLKKQIHALYFIGALILSLAAIISYLLARHLLAPVRRLTNGTKALSALQFDTRIEVGSGDELGQLAEDFNRMAATLKKYETLRQQWITDISHELRTPLAILRGEIEAMQDGIREMNIETLNSLHSELIRISRLVDDLHLLSLADSRNLFVKKEPVKSISVLEEVIKSFQARLDQEKVKLITNLKDCDQVVIEGDRDRLAQLFSNLIENSLRYTDPPATIKLSASCSGNKLSLSFEDSEPGVPSDSLNRIFDRLYRVDKSRSRRLGGSGLGLSICKQIVESHGGTIEARHSPLGGLRITIRIPVILGERQRVDDRSYLNRRG
jgi:two-component system, OmpR family, sensor histidine kinase BaeS